MSLELNSNPIVYRVQDKDGRGPWKPGFSHRWVEDRDDLDNLTPWPIEFGNVLSKAIYGMSLGCGCRTVDQLRRWFTPAEYGRLKGFGYHAVRMEVGRVLAESNLQLVFERVQPLKMNVEPFELYP